ncbi:MAG TPA: family 43 glycosylhydrolase [Polyangiaceae bacterium]|nr:family 43 glycosylhydrolase [Polyangiaceae bacterium]
MFRAKTPTLVAAFWLLLASGACGSGTSAETPSGGGRTGSAGTPSSAGGDTSHGAAGSAQSAGAAGSTASGGSLNAGGHGGGPGAAGAGESAAGSGGTASVAGGAGTSSAGGNAGGVSGAWPPSATFSNPILWQDLPDDEIIRVDDVFYYTASNMHYSPGAPILRSWDLVNWEYVGHAVPVLDFSAKYDLSGGQAYVKGTWASSLHYRKSNKTFYFLGCIEFGKTYIYTAPAAEGPWQKKSTINNCYYDAGMMADYDDSADDTMYVAFGGGGDISVAQLSADGLSPVKTQQVYTTNGAYTLEGSHFFKYKGNYYITPTRPADGEFVLKSSNVWGPYTSKALIDKTKGPVAGGGTPHQGSLIQTQKGDWYYMGFQDAYPGGRIPVLAPVKWSADGFPTVQLVDNAWGASYPYPDVPRPPHTTKPHTGTETFSGTTLAPEWEWNHNPDNSKWSINNGVTLQTATVTNDLYAARNTLTRRTIGPQSTSTVQLDLSGMKDGDVAGLALLKHMSAYVAVKKSGSSSKVSMVNGLAMNTSTWATTSTGTEAASSPISGNTIWLRATVDVRPGTGRQGKFSFSTDGTTFTAIGPAYTLNTDWQFFPGYRYGIFNFATAALGGSVTVKSFQLTVP